MPLTSELDIDLIRRSVAASRLKNSAAKARGRQILALCSALEAERAYSEDLAGALRRVQQVGR